MKIIYRFEAISSNADLLNIKNWLYILPRDFLKSIKSWH